VRTKGADPKTTCNRGNVVTTRGDRNAVKNDNLQDTAVHDGVNESGNPDVVTDGNRYNDRIQRLKNFARTFVRTQVLRRT